MTDQTPLASFVIAMGSAAGEGPTWFWKLSFTSVAWGAFREKVTVRSGLTVGALAEIAIGLAGAVAAAIPKGLSATRATTAQMISDNVMPIFFFEVDMGGSPFYC